MRRRATGGGGISEVLSQGGMGTVKKMLKGIWEFSRLASSNERQGRALWGCDCEAEEGEGLL